LAVLCPQPVGQINIEEYPALARLGARNLASPRLGFERVRVQAQEGGSLDEVEGFHLA